MGWSIVGVSHTICFDAWCKPACTLQKQCKTKNALQGLLRWPSGLSRVSSSITGRITSVLPPRMERNDTFTTFGQWQITCVIKKTMPPNRRPFLEGWKLSASLCVRLHMMSFQSTPLYEAFLCICCFRSFSNLPATLTEASLSRSRTAKVSAPVGFGVAHCLRPQRHL